jgi:predicted phage-related endonuclease
MNAPQGTEAWLAERAGHASASTFKDILAKIKSGEAASRRQLRLKLATERLTGLPVETYKNAAMEWGNQTESLARLAYEAASGNLVEETGFLKHPSVKWCGGSPDGLIGDDGGFEAKCPFVSTVHVETLLNGGIPSEHMAQVQGLMWVTNRKWWDFVSFDPRMPAHLQLHVFRVKRDEGYIKQLAADVVVFLNEVDLLVAKLNEKK